jgi:hypothetical protein
VRWVSWLIKSRIGLLALVGSSRGRPKIGKPTAGALLPRYIKGSGSQRHDLDCCRLVAEKRWSDWQAEGGDVRETFVVGGPRGGRPANVNVTTL